MASITNYFEKLAGVPVRYGRKPLASYGSKGVPYKFHCEKDFQEMLEAAFAELFDIAGLEGPEVIVSAGTFVLNKPGYHGKGRAFDIDSIFWKNRVLITKNYPSEKRFYLGVEAVLRKHFGTVLNFLYNKAHEDHFHIDDGTPVGFNPSSRSRVLFVQAALAHVHAINVGIDGVFGPQTEGAIKQVLKNVGLTGKITSKQVWLDFLSHTAKTSFEKEKAHEEKEISPSELLSDLLELVDHHLADHPAKKTIESGIMALVNHEKIKKEIT